MSVHRIEEWEVSWRERGKERTRRFPTEKKAREFARTRRTDAGRPATRRRVQWRVVWCESGRGSAQRQRSFDRKRDAEDLDREIKRRKRLGELALWEHRNRTVRELAREWCAKYAVPNLAEHTLDGYEPVLTKHVVVRMGDHRVGEVTPEVADLRAQLERAGVGRHTVRISLVGLQAMFRQAVAWGWVPTNPVKTVPKPSAKRERAVVCLAPTQVEAIRAALIDQDRLYAATLVNLVAYQGLRVPEEVLALEVRHVRQNTLLVEQRNIKGKIVGGQKVCGFHPRAIDWSSRRDVTSASTWSPAASAQGCSSHASTKRRGSRTTTRTGPAGSGTPRARRLGSIACRRTTCGTPTPRCRSGRACRSRRSPSRWGTRRR